MVPPVNSPSTNLVAVFTADFLTVGHEAAHKYLEARWMRPVSSEEIRQGIEAITEIIFRHKIELLLVDFRKTGVPSASDQNWLAKHVQSVNSTIPLRRSARLLSMEILQSIVCEVITEKVETFSYKYQEFASETLAKQWLFQEVE